MALGDLDDYLRYKIIYRNICGEGYGFLNIIISIFAMYLAFNGWAYSYVHEAKKRKS